MLVAIDRRLQEHVPLPQAGGKLTAKDALDEILKQLSLMLVVSLDLHGSNQTGFTHLCKHL